MGKGMGQWVTNCVKEEHLQLVNDEQKPILADKALQVSLRI